LCITIPKIGGLKEGDWVEVEKSKIKKITYSGVVADLFHYGHLQSIQFAKSIADYNIVGIMTDEAVEKYRSKPIANLQERKAILENLKCVDRVVLQHSRDHTENLQKIHEEFPHAELILVHGDDLGDILGADYVKQIGGKLIQHPYYARLSTFKIINELLEQRDKFKDMAQFTSYFKGGSEFAAAKSNKIIISSKADTLNTLKPLLQKSKIEPLFTFTISDWKNRKQEILQHIQQQFSPSKLVVRSSAVSEDTLEKSMAGYFESVLHIDSTNQTEIENAIKTVVQSYKEKNGESSFNQILVQKQTEDIIMSGVVFTRTLGTNGPYYVINYDNTTGSTDSVTAGMETQTMYLSHFATTIPENMKELLTAVQELEHIIPGLPLDIEFALTKNRELVIFQVRPLAANIHKDDNHEEVKQRLHELKAKFRKLTERQSHLAGDSTYFGDMPDWNPAEIIGDNPNHLDYSLYDYLITHSAWHEARTSQGYYNVNPAKLVELFGNKPYVNVRNTFNSFTPSSLSPPLREKLVSFYMEKLQHNPHLQDKVEFEVLFTCYDFNFDGRAQELRAAGFSEEEIMELKTSLLQLTNNLILSAQKNIDSDMKTVCSMEEFRHAINNKRRSEHHTPPEFINFAKLLLDDCRKKGTVQFSRLARLGFIGKILLKSMVHQGIIDQNVYDSFYNSIHTVATKISEDFRKLLNGEIAKEEFLQEYYHLRPGTYDITSPRYDLNPQLINTISLTMQESKKDHFHLDYHLASHITEALQQHGISCDAQHFFHFVEQATQTRELSKFEFTKNLSDALELIAKAGEDMGFTRKEIALLDINNILHINASELGEDITRQWKRLIKDKEKERTINQKLALPAVIFAEHNFDVIQHYVARPNFITQKKIQSKIININDIKDRTIPELEGSIVVLENGDPGYDWIFTRNPAGLITKYGGVASHMSIRCAEF
ncbi:MAG: PEP/pyruvate-binding domain-containing protein, partial [Nanoarchaeota archaeon]